MQKFNIRLNVAGKSYALGIEREKEEIFRRAEKEVNRLTAAVESQYMADREDYLAVVALQLAVKVVELEASRSLGRDIDELDALTRRLYAGLTRYRQVLYIEGIIPHGFHLALRNLTFKLFGV